MEYLSEVLEKFFYEEIYTFDPDGEDEKKWEEEYQKLLDNVPSLDAFKNLLVQYECSVSNEAAVKELYDFYISRVCKTFHELCEGGMYLTEPDDVLFSPGLMAFFGALFTRLQKVFLSFNFFFKNSFHGFTLEKGTIGYDIFVDPTSKHSRLAVGYNAISPIARRIENKKIEADAASLKGMFDFIVYQIPPGPYDIGGILDTLKSNGIALLRTKEEQLVAIKNSNESCQDCTAFGFFEYDIKGYYDDLMYLFVSKDTQFNGRCSGISSINSDYVSLFQVFQDVDEAQKQAQEFLGKGYIESGMLQEIKLDPFSTVAYKVAPVYFPKERFINRRCFSEIIQVIQSLGNKKVCFLRDLTTNEKDSFTVFFDKEKLEFVHKPENNEKIFHFKLAHSLIEQEFFFQYVSSPLIKNFLKVVEVLYEENQKKYILQMPLPRYSLQEQKLFLEQMHALQARKNDLEAEKTSISNALDNLLLSFSLDIVQKPWKKASPEVSRSIWPAPLARLLSRYLSYGNSENEKKVVDLLLFFEHTAAALTLLFWSIFRDAKRTSTGEPLFLGKYYKGGAVDAFDDGQKKSVSDKNHFHQVGFGSWIFLMRKIVDNSKEENNVEEQFEARRLAARIVNGNIIGLLDDARLIRNQIDHHELQLTSPGVAKDVNEQLCGTLMLLLNSLDDYWKEYMLIRPQGFSKIKGSYHTTFFCIQGDGAQFQKKECTLSTQTNMFKPEPLDNNILYLWKKGSDVATPIVPLFFFSKEGNDLFLYNETNSSFSQVKLSIFGASAKSGLTSVKLNRKKQEWTCTPDEIDVDAEKMLDLNRCLRWQ